MNTKMRTLAPFVAIAALLVLILALMPAAVSAQGSLFPDPIGDTDIQIRPIPSDQIRTAQPGSGAGAPGTLQTVVNAIGNAIFAFIPIASSLALLAFFWGLAMYLFNFGEGKEDKQKQGRNLMFYGILAIFVMLSIFGIVLLLRASFGIGNMPSLPAPSVEGI